MKRSVAQLETSFSEVGVMQLLLHFDMKKVRVVIDGAAGTKEGPSEDGGEGSSTVASTVE